MWLDLMLEYQEQKQNAFYYKHTCKLVIYCNNILSTLNWKGCKEVKTDEVGREENM